MTAFDIPEDKELFEDEDDDYEDDFYDEDYEESSEVY